MELQCVLAEPDQLSEIVMATAHHRSSPVVCLVSSERLRTFFEDVLINTSLPEVPIRTFAEYPQEQYTQPHTAILLEVPTSFETMQSVLEHSHTSNNQTVLLLLKTNRKYLNMLGKKLEVSTSILEFSHNKFVGFNDKLRQLVESNYDINRAGFYAYGAAINNYKANMLKKIFRAELLDVAALARSFGFSTPPRVTNTGFLAPKARNELKSSKKKARKERRAEAGVQQRQQQVVQEVKPIKVGKKGKKIKRRVIAE